MNTETEDGEGQCKEGLKQRRSEKDEGRKRNKKGRERRTTTYQTAWCSPPRNSGNAGD